MKKSITKKELKDFGLLITFGFPLIFGLIVPFVSGHSYKTWPFVIALTSFLLTILNPKLLLIPYKIWMRIGNILGFINSHIILGLVFYIILLPTSFIMRIFGYDPLKIKKTKQKSYKEYKKDYRINLNKIF